MRPSQARDYKAKETYENVLHNDIESAGISVLLFEILIPFSSIENAAKAASALTPASRRRPYTPLHLLQGSVQSLLPAPVAAKKRLIGRRMVWGGWGGVYSHQASCSLRCRSMRERAPPSPDSALTCNHAAPPLPSCARSSRPILLVRPRCTRWMGGGHRKKGCISWLKHVLHIVAA